MRIHEQVLAVLGEAVPVLVVACLVFLLIRTNLIERYHIPSKSMEPTLHGDRKRGDWVLVNKTAYWFDEPKPFDMVVVRPCRRAWGKFPVLCRRREA